MTLSEVFVDEGELGFTPRAGSVCPPHQFGATSPLGDTKWPMLDTKWLRPLVIRTEGSNDTILCTWLILIVQNDLSCHDGKNPWGLPSKFDLLTSYSNMLSFYSGIQQSQQKTQGYI